MPLFKVNGATVTPLQPWHSEHWAERIQQLSASNLEKILGVIFLAGDYQEIPGGRIDTLGIDASGSPCIINYKRDKNDDIVSRSVIALQWLQERKTDFESLCQQWKINDAVHWQSPKIFCIAEKFNKADIDATDKFSSDTIILLLRCCLYDQHILLVEPENL